MCPASHTVRRGQDAAGRPSCYDETKKGGSSIQLSLVQMDSAHLDPTVNVDRIESWVERERECGAELVVFPELATTGYLEPIMPGEAYSPGVVGADTWPEFLTKFTGLAETIPGPTTDRLAALARRLDVGIVFGILEAHPTLRGAVANTVVAVDPGGVAGLQRKLHMPWNEKHVFTPGNELNVFDVLGVKVGINVCYDAYFPEQTRALALRGAELVISCFTGPSRGNSDGQFPSDRAAFLSRTRAMENGVYFAAVNRVGHQGDYHFIGNSAVAGPDGSLIANTESVAPIAVRAEIDVNKLASARFALTLLKDRRVDLYGDLSKSWEVLAVPS